MSRRSRLRSNPRRRKHRLLSTLGKAALWYGGFCVANLGFDYWAGTQGGADAGGVVGVLAAMNGALMPLNVLNLLSGSSSSALAGPAYTARILGYNNDGTPIWG